MSSVQPLVSIALCTYNGADYLCAQLDTLVNQTYSPIEIIVVDDCSADDTQEILQRYAQNYPQVQLYTNEQNLGYIKNYERAILLCSGELIAPADQDDVWDLKKIELMVNSIGDHMLLYHDSEFIDEAGKCLGKKISDVRRFYAGNDSKVFLFENCVSGHAMLFKRQLLDYFDSFNSIIIHDWWLAYIALNNGSIAFLPQVLVQYRQHNTASTNILRQERSNTVKGNSLQKIEHQLAIIIALAKYPHNKNAAFKQQLLMLMQSRMNAYLSFGLAAFVFKNRHELLYIQKKSAFSKLNFIIKMAWGYKLKRLFN